ncbi:hypothetical protein FS837_012850 [Tulasnella sp. UAMH 9824]|nr:hypothetical protein FS837_012850 [Tulasnella sp. UAMH 9824]
MPPAQSSEISFAPPPFPLFSDISGIPCKIAGCIRTEEYRGGGYCSEAHQRQGVRDGLDPGCLYCKTMPRESPRSLFCGNKCSQAATNSAPVLLEVSTSDPRFTEVAGNFKTAWKHTPNPPRVARVYKIILPQSLIDSYDAYKRNIEGTGNFVGRGMEPANQRRRWHGARRVCKIGDDEKNLNFCNNSQCSVCLILKNSYDVKFAMVGMFGKGIYTTATSSKSDTYTRGAAPGSRYKTMFLNKVAVGKGKILTSADNSLRAAPAGFDSVIANPGSELNYDELIVYDNNAIRPSWLLLYETK